MYVIRMKDVKKELKNNVNAVVSILLAISIILIFMGKDKYIGVVTNWAVSIITGLFTTALSQKIVQRFSGGSLEKIFLNITVFGKKYSVSVFILISIIVKMLIFK